MEISSGLEQRACKICSGINLKEIYSLPKACVKVLQCSNCGFEFVKELYTETESKGIYTNLYEHDLDLSDHASAKETRFGEKVLELETLKSLDGATVLDVGCGGGEFLSVVQDRGAKPFGIEFSKAAIRFARDRYALEITDRPLESSFWQEASMDVVTMWDVIEHAADPLKLLERARMVLKKGGLLGMTTPVRDSLIHGTAVALYRISLGRGTFLLRHRYNMLHLQMFTTHELENILSALKFRVHRLEKIMEFSYPLEWYFDIVTKNTMAKKTLGTIASLLFSFVPMKNKVLIWAEKT